MAALKLLGLTTTFFVFFETTAPEDLGNSLVRAGLPFAAAFVFAAALQFVPVIGRKARTVIDAQRSRGIGLEAGWAALRHWPAFLAPLLIQSLYPGRRAGRGHGSPRLFAARANLLPRLSHGPGRLAGLDRGPRDSGIGNMVAVNPQDYHKPSNPDPWQRQQRQNPPDRRDPGGFHRRRRSRAHRPARPGPGPGWTGGRQDGAAPRGGALYDLPHRPAKAHRPQRKTKSPPWRCPTPGASKR